MKRYVKTQVHEQKSSEEYGTVALDIILKYYGKNIEWEKLYNAVGVTNNTTSATDIMRAATQYGLECKGYRRDAKSLLKMEKPCILHWNGNHFVVLEGFRWGLASINDPAIGRKMITIKALKKSYSGVVLTFRPWPTIPAIQRSPSECGAAALTAVLSYWGIYASLDEVFHKVGTTANGCSAADILRTAREYGLEGKGYKCERDFILNINEPCILHWNENHFLVLEGFHDGLACVNDPAQGHRKMTKEELLSGFSGIVLVFKK